MPTQSASRGAALRNILARIGAALHEQREHEARLVIRRYRHLLDPPRQAAAEDALVNSKDTTRHADKSGAHHSASGRADLQRA